MLVRIEQLLSADEAARCRARLEAAPWTDGRITAGEQSAKAKHNRQVPAEDPIARELGEEILGALGRNPAFISTALPLRVFPPLFNRYDAGMRFDAHVDNAIRHPAGTALRLRTDVSATLFLTPPGDYDGGELIIQDVYGEQSVKLQAGDLVLYPAASVHRVNPVTRGSRWASFFWVQSMVREDARRALLYELDAAIMQARTALGDDNPAVLKLTATYHNLIRMWAET